MLNLINSYRNMPRRAQIALALYMLGGTINGVREGKKAAEAIHAEPRRTPELINFCYLATCVTSGVAFWPAYKIIQYIEAPHQRTSLTPTLSNSNKKEK